MIWRISETYVSGTEAKDATPYETDADALAVIKAHFERGMIKCASMQDHDYNRVEWPEIKRRLGLSEGSN